MSGSRPLSRSRSRRLSSNWREYISTPATKDATSPMRISSATTATAHYPQGRPAVDALRDKARMRELEVVVVLSPDPLARNYVHQMVLIEEFEKVGCRVEFVERPMSSEPNDQLQIGRASCRERV